MASNSEKALEYKNKGNTFFAKKSWKKAHEQYTLAIELDDTNAIYFSNRAACSIFLKKHEDARKDAEKATTLDPKYSKAWSRLGTALMELRLYNESIEAWKSAISALPENNLTAMEEQQKKTYKQGLWAAEGALRSSKGEGPFTLKGDAYKNNMPWERATRMMGELKASRNFHSSAYVIEEAYSAFAEAINTMKMTRKITTGRGSPPMFVGMTGALVNLSNAIMMDERVFHIADPNFVEFLNNQIQMEVTQVKGWVPWNQDRRVPASRIMDEAKSRLASFGWDNVRPALSITTRCLIIHAFIQLGANTNHKLALDFYSVAEEIIETGRRIWPNVHKDDRGVIFDDTFLWGVKNLRLAALHAACSQDLDALNPEYSVIDLAKSAQELMDAILASTPPSEIAYQISPAFTPAFYDYPLGQAYCLLGWSSRKMARMRSIMASLDKSMDRDKAASEIRAVLRQSADFYRKAALTYPEDDEHHYFHLKWAISGYCRSGTPLSAILPLLEQFVKNLPKARKIWEFSAMGSNDNMQRDIKRWVDWTAYVKGELRDGKVKLDDMVMPEWEQTGEL